jgi:hypothetical protein
VKPFSWIAVVLLAPLGAAQAPTQAVVSGPAPVPVAAPGEFEVLSRVASSPGRRLTRADRGLPDAEVVRAMDALARAGDARAFLWCARRLDALPPADRTQRMAQGFAALVREHADASWLFSTELDPLAALDGADAETRRAVAEALAVESTLDGDARRLALLLGAAALAPTSARDVERAAEALACLDELRSLGPADALSARAADLAWRIEHLAPGRSAPILLLRDVDGNELALEDWRGAHVLLEVWRDDDPQRFERARELARTLERVRAQRPDLDLRVLAVGLGRDALAFRRELEELELPWPTSFESADGGGAARGAWRLDGTATRLWIDPGGVVRLRGGSAAELEAHLLESSAAAAPTANGASTQDRAQGASGEARR